MDPKTLNSKAILGTTLVVLGLSFVLKGFLYLAVPGLIFSGILLFNESNS